MKLELDVLVEQLDEVLGEPIVDPDDALEVAILAGLAERLGAPPDALAAAAWRDGDGAALIAETFDQVDLEPLLEELDAAASGGMTDEEVEEALYDVDDVVAAAIWARRAAAVRGAARRAAEIVRQVPDPFVHLADLAVQLAKLRAVAEHLELYDYWLAVADAREVDGSLPLN